VLDERWVNRPPETMLETFRWFRGEGFGLIVEDLLGLPREPGVIVEGFRVLPHLVRPLLAMPGHAVWLPPMTDFRRAASDSRCSLWVPVRLPVRWSLWPQPAQGHTRLGCGRPTRSAALLGACRLVTGFISKEEP
jgi:hypothetical protein